MSVKVRNPITQLYIDDAIFRAVHVQDGWVLSHVAHELESLMTVASLVADTEWVRYAYVGMQPGIAMSCEDTSVGIVARNCNRCGDAMASVCIVA